MNGNGDSKTTNCCYGHEDIEHPIQLPLGLWGIYSTSFFNIIMERTWVNLVTLAPLLVEGLLGGVQGCCGGVANLCSGEFGNGLAWVSFHPGSFSVRDKIDDTVVDKDALDDVDENE